MQLGSEQKKLVLQNIRLVNFVVKELGCTNPSEYEDALSEGTLGLCYAACTFKEEKKINFSTYATRCIRNSILNFYAKSNKNYGNISLDDLKDLESKQFLYEKLIEDTSINLEDSLDKADTICQILSIILNCFSNEASVILLLYFAGLSQMQISNSIRKKLSSVYCITHASLRKVKRYFRNDFSYNKFFIVRKSYYFDYEVSFSTKKIQDVKRILNSLNFKKIKVSYYHERVAISLLLNDDSLIFLSRLIQELFSNKILKK